MKSHYVERSYHEIKIPYRADRDARIGELADEFLHGLSYPILRFRNSDPPQINFELMGEFSRYVILWPLSCYILQLPRIDCSCGNNLDILTINLELIRPEMRQISASARKARPSLPRLSPSDGGGANNNPITAAGKCKSW